LCETCSGTDDCVYIIRRIRTDSGLLVVNERNCCYRGQRNPLTAALFEISRDRPRTLRKTRYTSQRAEHWDGCRRSVSRHESLFVGAYHRRVGRGLPILLPPGKRVLENRFAGRAICWLLLRPEVGVGIDFSRKMIDAASPASPTSEFHSRRRSRTLSSTRGSTLSSFPTW